MKTSHKILLTTITKPQLALTICLLWASNASADLNERIAIAMTKAAQNVILNENSLDGVDITKAIKLTETALTTSKTVLSALEDDKTSQLADSSRRQDEARFLSDVAAYPFIKLSRVGYLYQVQQEGPYHQTPIMADAYDNVKIKIEAHSHDGISLIDEKLVNTPIPRVHSAFGAIIREMKKGETRKAFIPSSIMFGASHYRDIKPYSTIIATITLVDIIPSKVKQASSP